ncbi:PQQ-binding-like beta-propeller repeat protein [bacterium]|nr:PQQ-binding-like beta-propeller repeat protein [bacterium]
MVTTKKKKGKRQNFFASQKLNESSVFDSNGGEELSAAKKFINSDLVDQRIENEKKESDNQSRKLESVEKPVLLEVLKNSFDLTAINSTSFIKLEKEEPLFKKVRYSIFHNDSIWLFFDSKCISFDLGMSELFQFSVDSDFLNYEPLILDNKVYFIQGKKILELDYSSGEKKQYSISFIPTSNLHIFEGSFFLISDSNRLISFNSSFEENWSFSIDNYLFTQPTFENGSIWLGTSGGIMYQLDKNGEVIWTYNSKSPIFSSPLVSGTNLFLTTLSGKIQVLSILEKDYRFSIDTGFALFDAPIIHNGRVYVANRSYLYEISLSDGSFKNIANFPNHIETLISLGEYLGVYTIDGVLILVNDDITQYNLLDSQVLRKPFAVMQHLFYINGEQNFAKIDMSAY